MALEYMLRMATDLEPEKVLDFLASVLNLEKESNEVTGPGVFIYAFPEDEPRRSIFVYGAKFVPTVWVTFRLDKFNNTELGKDTFLRGTMELLRQSPGDAVLLFNGEDVVFLRAKGSLTLNDKSGFWTPSRLSQVKLPYEMKTIPTL